MKFIKLSLAALFILLATSAYAAPPAGVALLSANTPASGYANMSSTTIASATVTNGGTGYRYQQIAYPSGDGASSGTWAVYPTSPTTKYDKVDDPAAVPDDTATYMDSASSGPYFFFTFPAFSVPVGSTISSVTVYYRAKTSSAPKAVDAGLDVNGVNYYNSPFPSTSTTSYANYYFTWFGNPATGLAWTVADINGTGTHPLQQFGVNFPNSGVTNYLTQVYAVVTYGTAPTVTISGNATATASCTDSSGNPQDSVQSITITSGGSGYTAQPDLVITGGNGDATATDNLTGSVIDGVTISDGGSGYSAPPTVVFSGGGGSRATATAAIDSTGAVTAVTMTNEGSGYTSPPTVTFISLAGNYIATQYLTSGTTYTPDAGTNQIRLRMVGGGGGGGYNVGGSGGAGGFLEKWLVIPSGTATYSIGNGGTGGTSTVAPGSGTNTTFVYNGVTYTAYGGGGGANVGTYGRGAAVSVNGDLNLGGGDGNTGITGSAGIAGGASYFGGGTSHGDAPTVYGSGGGGGPTTTPGGAGGAGLIIVDEYR